MAPLVASSTLSANLASLGEVNADLARRLRETEPRDDIRFAPTPQGVPAAEIAGRQLCSRHRPLDEARRLADTIDLVENATVAVLGFGLGYHVQQIAERMGKAGIVIVFEPDVALLRAVLEHVDHSAWLERSLTVWITDPEDRAILAGKLTGAESIVAQGTTVLEHPASRARLGRGAAAMSELLSAFVTNARTTLMTTLVRSVHTVRNLLLNLDHYAGGPGITELERAAAGRPAIVVSAGPSLARNLHRLAADGVRDRCVIVAVQTTLQPLLEAGIRPHFVTALDYHEISRRFYEDLAGHDLSDVTLVADPKAHPVILDAFPGPVRCCRSPFLDNLLGDAQRPMGELPAGATVAHLALYLARHLGCDPIALTGQDLGFTDGLYYAPGTAIDAVWAPELNPFNTIEMMQWQRIARHRLHLKRVTDVHGRTIFTDAQMLTYLQQFERDFAAFGREGIRIIDATEGGVARQHVTSMPLAEVLDRWATDPLPPLPLPEAGAETDRLQRVAKRLDQVRREVLDLQRTSRRTETLIQAMLRDQADPARMNRHFQKIDANRRRVEQRFETFQLLNHLNQLGVYKRMRADRRLQMQRDLDPVAQQRAQLQRDLENVQWIADAAEEFTDQLNAARRLMDGESVQVRVAPPRNLLPDAPADVTVTETCIAALVPVDPGRNGLGQRRSPAEPFMGRPVLQATLERLGACEQLHSIILLAPRDEPVQDLLDLRRIPRPVEIERVDGSPYGPEHEAIAVARAWADTCWRGGIAGASVYDEVLCPVPMHRIMLRRGLTAALLVGPDWPLLDVSDGSGCPAVIRRHLELPERHRLVFTQAPPGLCGCLVSTELMGELAQGNRLCTVGALLVYQPHAPQGDPIARDANVQIDPAVRRSLVRATFDTPRQRELIKAALRREPDLVDQGAPAIAAALTAAGADAGPLPREIVLELTTRRSSTGLFARSRAAGAARDDLDLETARHLFERIGQAGDVLLTLDGCGDPLLHEQVNRVITLARESGIQRVHVRTELRCDSQQLDDLLAAGPDVISVDLHADRAATYERMMGDDRFKQVLMNIDHLVRHRRRLTDGPPTAAVALPWIVPRLQRCAATLEDIDSFFDRWQHQLGTCVLEGTDPDGGDALDEGARIVPARIPAAARTHQLRRRMIVLCDGSVPASIRGHAGRPSIGNVRDADPADLWAAARGATGGRAGTGDLDTMNDERALAVIIGRAGSRGLPGKNALPLTGRPMVCHSIDHARHAALVTAVVVSTDCPAVAAAARGCRVTVVDRPAELAGDDVPVDAPVRHAVETAGAGEDVIVVLYANVPVRPAGLIDRAIAMLQATGADSVQSYTAVGKHHPEWMVRLDETGHVSQFLDSPAYRRQDLCPLLIPDGGVIAVQRRSLFAIVEGEPHAFLGTDRRGIVSPPGTVIDVDEPLDLLVAEAVLQRAAAGGTNVKIGQRRIGRGRRPYVIAELGVNHDGSVGRALELVDAARDAGADAIKLQLFRAGRLLSREARLATYQARTGADDPRTLLGRLELSLAEMERVARRARSRGMDAIVTVFSLELVTAADRLPWSAFKVASPDVINRPLIEKLAATGRPLILSTGAATIDEVAAAVGWVAGHPHALMQCVSAYPTPDASAHIGGLVALQELDACPVGYSDHTTAVDTAAIAVAAGASLLEKHLTYDRAARGPDHAASLDPAAMAEYVRHARRAARLLGAPVKRVYRIEQDVRDVSRQSLVTRRRLPRGQVVRRGDLTVKRPGTGLPPWRLESVVGRRTRRAVPADTPLREEDLA